MKQLDRFEKIYKTREEAINVLSEFTAEYSSLVSIRYGSDNIILVIYKSNKKGDYEILLDREGTEAIVYSGKQRTPDQPDSEVITLALFGATPKNGDTAVIESFDGSSVKVYTYLGGNWILTKGSTQILIPENSNTVNITFSDSDIPEERKIKADVKIDQSSLVYDEEIDRIKVGIIYGGTW